MYCPKCRNEQKNSVECEACGLIFEKFRRAQNRKKKDAALKLEGLEKVASEEKSSSGLKLFQVLILIVLVAGTTYYFTGYRPQEKEDTIVVAPPEVPTEEATVMEQKVPDPVVQSQALPQPALNAQTAIQRARKSTVSIETPWGTGSGFFVNKNYIVTNRHVVEFDEKKLASFKQKMERTRRMIELEKQKISEMKRTYSKMRKGPSRSQLGIIIASREEELRRVLPQYEEGERRLAELDRKVRPSDIKIVLNDGSEHFANYLLVSETIDLALLSLYAGDWTYIERAPGDFGMQQGDKVYTIGSPVGLRQTVTGGIFSGYVKQGSSEQVYLQTDAAINPGNSGGPLIDEHGFATE